MQRIASTAKMMAAIGATCMPAVVAKPMIRYFSDATTSGLYQLYSDLPTKYLDVVFSAILNGNYGINPNVTINSLAVFETIFKISNADAELLRHAGDVGNQTLEAILQPLIAEGVDRYHFDHYLMLGLCLGVPLTVGGVLLAVALAWVHGKFKDCCKQADPAPAIVAPQIDALDVENDGQISDEEATPAKNEEAGVTTSSGEEESRISIKNR